MPAQPSPYARAAGRLRDMGYHPLPVAPGAKYPGALTAGRWHAMPRWQEWCARQPPEFLHERWDEWDDAGVCITHGAVVGLDVDTDRNDVATAVLEAVPPSPVRRRGQKGWMGYYRPGPGLGELARLRWYDGEGVICVELLLHGTQSVLPPTVHPQTGKPYRWITPDTLEDTAPDDLPELPPDILERLDAALAARGISRNQPKRDRVAVEATALGRSDLEKPRFRSMNDRALAALDRWFPALGLPGTRQRGACSWAAVAAWRPSSSGRPLEKRGANLHASPSGIRDFGDGEAYTAIDVVMRARGCSFDGAVDWLEPFIEPEPQAEIDLDAIAAAAERRRVAAETADHTQKLHDPIPAGPAVGLDDWCAMPAAPTTKPRPATLPRRLPSAAQFDVLVPRTPQPFPLAPDSFGGLLGEVAQFIDEASVVSTEAGPLAVALPLLGAVMGRAYQSPTRLRTNIYAVALGASGSGKTSLVSPAKELLQLAGVPDLLGQDRIASGSGLLRMLTVEPRRVCFLDEFGHMLQQIGAPGAGTHMQQILTEFTKLYSNANVLYTGTAYAGREPDRIDCPHLCLFGMTTPEQFWRAFGSSSLEDGSIARFLLFPIGMSGVKGPSDRFRDQTVAGIKAVLDAIRGRLRGNLGVPELCTAPFDARAERAYEALRSTMESCARYSEVNGMRGVGPVLLRVAENAVKIALISAIGRDPLAPVVTMDDFEKAHLLARWSACEMVRNIGSHIADNQVERDVNEVERRILKAGPEGILKGKLKDQVRAIRKREFDDIVASLEESGRITIERSNSATKPGFRLTHCSFGGEG